MLTGFTRQRNPVAGAMVGGGGGRKHAPPAKGPPPPRPGGGGPQEPPPLPFGPQRTGLRGSFPGDYLDSGKSTAMASMSVVALTCGLSCPSHVEPGVVQSEPKNHFDSSERSRPCVQQIRPL